MNILIATTTTKINAIFLVVVLVVGTSTAISPSFIIVEVQTQETESDIKETTEIINRSNPSHKLNNLGCELKWNNELEQGKLKVHDNI